MQRIKCKKIIFICLLVVICIGIFVNINRKQNTKSLLIVGDSIGEGAGCSDPALKWYKKLIPYMKEHYGINLKITNISMGGNTSYAGYVRTMNLDEKKAYDYVIICFGENDKVSDLSLYYELLIRTIKGKYPSATLISILESSQREYTEKIRIIQKVCEYYDIYVADTIAAFNNSGQAYEELCDDGTHPNDRGYELYFDIVAETVERCYGNSSEKKNEDIKPLNSEVNQFGTYRYYSKDDLKKIENLTYKLDIDMTVERLGIDYTTINGEHWIRIKNLEGEQVEKKIVWDKNFQLRYIEVATEHFINNGEIILEFSSEEMQEKFNGIVINGN